MDELIGDHAFNTATCSLVRPMALPMKMRVGVVELVRLFVPEESRGKGDASQLLHNICREADKQRKVIMLSVQADDTGLCAFYTRFGFQPIQAKPVLMARHPFAAPLKRSAIGDAVSVN